MRQDKATKTFALYESPKRIMSFVDFMISAGARCSLCLMNDMTKLHEMSFRGSPIQVKEQLIAKGNYEKGLSYAEEALKSDSLNELFLLAKSTMLLNLGRYDECLATSERLILENNRMAEAYYNAGTACLNIALNLDPRRYRKQIRRMYQKAQPFMESYRKLMPDAKNKWGPSLYRIYFNLNLGKQFDEIDKILKK